MTGLVIPPGWETLVLRHPKKCGLGLEVAIGVSADGRPTGTSYVFSGDLLRRGQPRRGMMRIAQPRRAGAGIEWRC